MKFKVNIVETVQPEGDIVIIYFQSDKQKQHFQINCSFNAFNLGIRLWDTWEFNLKFRAEEFEDPKTKVKSYFTHFDCDKAEPIYQIQGKYKKN